MKRDVAYHMQIQDGKSKMISVSSKSIYVGDPLVKWLGWSKRPGYIQAGSTHSAAE